MVLDFDLNLEEAKRLVDYLGEDAEFVVFDISEPVSPEEIQARYSKALWTTVEVINERYKDKLLKPFDLYSWIEHNPADELAYFLSEAGSNTLNYSQYKAPEKFHIYFGKKGFIVSIFQQGVGFNAKEVFNKKLKNNEGAGFTFYEECGSKIFFDDLVDAKVVSMLYFVK